METRNDGTGKPAERPCANGRRCFASPSGQRRLYQVTTYVLAAADEIDAVTQAIARSLCQDLEHEGPCAHPWEIRTVRAEDVLSLEEVSELVADLLPPDQRDA